MSIAMILILLALTVGAWVVIYQLTVQIGRLLVRLEAVEKQLPAQGIAMGTEADRLGGFPAGAVLNDFELPVLGGGKMTLSQYRGRKVLLIYFSPACAYCREMVRALGATEPADDPRDAVVLIVSEGSAEENRGLFEPHGVKHPVLLQNQREVAELHRAFATPTAYLVTENGVTSGELRVGRDAILAAAREGAAGRGFTRSTRQSQLVREGLKAGTLAPAFRLPQVNGAELSSEELRGQKLLLVFSDPDCAPCDRLAPKLEKVHRSGGAVRVVMISRGTQDANRAKIAEFALTFPVVLQRHWEVSREYGMFATPVGYLIDEAGILISDVLVGEAAILGATG